MKPVFVHSLWRTGSTYLWNKFRRSGQCHAYCEPFHELLQVITGKESLNRNQVSYLSHPDLDRHYFDEYPVASAGGVPNFRDRFSYWDYCLPETDEHPDLRSYVQTLIDHAYLRPTFHFCRSALRAKWLRHNFPSLNLYIVRDPRCQWESYLSFPEGYFNAATFLIVAHNRDCGLLRPLTSSLALPEIAREGSFTEIAKSKAHLNDFGLKQLYLLFYYIWSVSLLEARSVCDFLIDIDALSDSSTERRRAQSFLAENDLLVEFGDCRTKRYPQFTMRIRQMEEVENQVAYLIHREFDHGILSN